MSRTAPQLNIRSAFARDRAAVLARQTGMTTTQVVEEALRAYAPPAPTPGAEGPRLVRKGRLLVMTGGPPTTIEQILAQIDDAREERASMVENPVG